MIQDAFFGDHAQLQHAYSALVKHGPTQVRHNVVVDLGKRIQQRAEELGFDAKDVAKACGVTDKAVYQWYSGSTKNVRPANLVRVAKLLRTTEAWLALEDGPKERSNGRPLEPSASALLQAYESLPEEYQISILKTTRELAHQIKLQEVAKKKQRS